MKPEDLTNQQVRKIGEDYLKQFPDGCWAEFFGVHTNQYFAKTLQNFPGKETAQERWFHLLRVYLQLGKPHGVLADTLDNLFHSAFKVRIEKYVVGGTGNPYFLSTYSVVSHLTHYVNNYFKNNKELHSIGKISKPS